LRVNFCYAYCFFCCIVIKGLEYGENLLLQICP